MAEALCILLFVMVHNFSDNIVGSKELEIPLKNGTDFNKYEPPLSHLRINESILGNGSMTNDVVRKRYIVNLDKHPDFMSLPKSTKVEILKQLEKNYYPLTDVKDKLKKTITKLKINNVSVYDCIKTFPVFYHIPNSEGCEIVPSILKKATLKHVNQIFGLNDNETYIHAYDVSEFRRIRNMVNNVNDEGEDN
ncbi:hypothetical protein GEMRC1_012810 [Eukaryota sp. GEM-RC1]